MSMRKAEEAIAEARYRKKIEKDLEWHSDFAIAYDEMRKRVIELEATLKSAKATVRALQSSNHVIFN